MTYVRECDKGSYNLMGAALLITALFLLLLPASSGLARAISPDVVSIAAANTTSVAVMSDGTVWQWGYYYGSTDWTTPQKISINDVKMVGVGDDHILALKNDGTVWAWGSNGYGQLGDGTYNDSIQPVEVQGISNVISIAAGTYHSLALERDGSVWAWGSNNYGQLGEGSMNYNGSPVPIQVEGMEGITAISSGGSHCLALQSDSVVWAWGDNDHGVLGDGTNTARFTPVMSKMNDIEYFDAGDSGHALAVKDDGTVWAWGYNYMGQLGQGGVSLNDQGIVSIGSEADSYNPAIVNGISDAVAVAAGGSHSVALTRDGSVWTWGSNLDGQLGMGTIGGSDQTSPIQVPGLNNVTAIAAGMYHTLALKSDGTVWAWGLNSDGQIGNGGASTAVASPVQIPIDVQATPVPSPTPLIPIMEAVTATPAPTNKGSHDYMLIGAVVLLAVLIILVAAAVYVFMSGRNGMKKRRY
jgi:alpha-tubulin suppressor-like RCC1 family protein